MEEAQTASQHQTETVQTDNVVAAVPTDGARAGATDPDPAALEQARHEDDAAKKARVDEAMAAVKAMGAWMPHRAKRTPAKKTAKAQESAGTAKAGPVPDVSWLDPARIVVDAAVQPRLKLDDAVVEDYAEAMRAGDGFPFVAVFRDPGSRELVLADGFHRHAAAIKAGVKLIRAQIWTGTRRDAILHAAGANARHGLRRSNADKRKAVMTLLNDSEWSQLPDREIARRCAVTHPFVASLRQELAGGNGYQADATDAGQIQDATGEGRDLLQAGERDEDDTVDSATDAADSEAGSETDSTVPTVEGTAAAVVAADEDSSPPQAHGDAADTSMEAMIPAGAAIATEGSDAAAEPSPEALMHLILDVLQRDFSAYPRDIAAAIRDGIGKQYPALLAAVQAHLDAVLAKLQTDYDAAAKAEADAEAAAQAQTLAKEQPTLQL